jgi:hypothetical protein
MEEAIARIGHADAALAHLARRAVAIEAALRFRMGVPPARLPAFPARPPAHQVAARGAAPGLGFLHAGKLGADRGRQGGHANTGNAANEAPARALFGEGEREPIEAGGVHATTSFGRGAARLLPCRSATGGGCRHHGGIIGQRSRPP